MKKLIICLISAISLLPINVLAYSNYVIPGGESIGIKVESDGVLVIGFYKVNGSYNNKTIKIGDYIKKINGENISSINDLISKLEEYADDDTVEVEVLRNNKLINIKFNLTKENGKIKTGLYVKDSLSGIGTLTFIDPASKIYGALGHEILESKTNEIFDLDEGIIYESSITGIDRSINGSPGTKNALFNIKNVYGDIKKNTNKGIYGTYNELPKKDLIEVGKSEDLKKGEATIYTVTSKNTVSLYKIKITDIDYKSKIKNIYFEIIDEELLELSGGIVQGMSGSPIIQDNKLYGAVTHVVVDNVKRGYGIFITTMLEEGEK